MQDIGRPLPVEGIEGSGRDSCRVHPQTILDTPELSRSDPEKVNISFRIIENMETALNTSEIPETSSLDNQLVDNLTRNCINGFIALICILDLFLIMAINLDSYVAVLFPLWHHCHHLPYLSTLVCGLIWILSFLPSAVHFILHQTRSSGRSPFLYQLIVNGLFCTPLMVLSTVTLWIHMSFPHPVLLIIGIGSATLKSSINPLLYFLVERKQRGKSQPRTSLKVALQRVFKNEQQGSLEEQQAAKEERS
ncbi:Mas1: Proto-oncogene Mas [Crotalus adamanteus]